VIQFYTNLSFEVSPYVVDSFIDKSHLPAETSSSLIIKNTVFNTFFQNAFLEVKKGDKKSKGQLCSGKKQCARR